MWARVLDGGGHRRRCCRCSRRTPVGLLRERVAHEDVCRWRSSARPGIEWLYSVVRKTNRAALGDSCGFPGPHEAGSEYVGIGGGRRSSRGPPGTAAAASPARSRTSVSKRSSSEKRRVSQGQHLVRPGGQGRDVRRDDLQGGGPSRHRASGAGRLTPARSRKTGLTSTERSRPSAGRIHVAASATIWPSISSMRRVRRTRSSSERSWVTSSTVAVEPRRAPLRAARWPADRGGGRPRRGRARWRRWPSAGPARRACAPPATGWPAGRVTWSADEARTWRATCARRTRPCPSRPARRAARWSDRRAGRAALLDPRRRRTLGPSVAPTGGRLDASEQPRSSNVRLARAVLRRRVRCAPPVPDEEIDRPGA